MTRIALAALLLGALPAVSRAQDALTPTDVLEFGQVSGTGRFQLVNGSANLVIDDPTVDLDLDVDIVAYQFVFEAGVGLGMGFEVELAIPYQIQGTSEGDGSGILGPPFPPGYSSLETEGEELGFGDLEARAIYRLLKEDASTPQLILGLIIVAPTGNDKRGETEFVVNGTQAVESEEGGIGNGVWAYGLGGGISKKLGAVEPYFLAGYVWGGTRQRNGVDEDRSDVGSLAFGAEWHATPQWRIDTRATLQFVGEDVTEDGRLEQKEEAHLQYGGQALLYVNLGTGLTLVAGGGATFIEDHETDDVSRTELRETFLWSLQIGLHVLLGK